MYLLVLCFAGILASGAQQGSPPKTPQDAFYSGTVSELSADKITVSKTILGKPAEKRTFAINQATKIQGKLKVKARVTVRFVATDDGDVATSILVRSETPPASQKKKPAGP